MITENYLFLSQSGPNEGKWVVCSEEACLNLAEQGYDVRKIVVDTDLVGDSYDEDDPWRGYAMFE